MYLYFGLHSIAVTYQTRLLTFLSKSFKVVSEIAELVSDDEDSCGPCADGIPDLPVTHCTTTNYAAESNPTAPPLENRNQSSEEAELPSCFGATSNPIWTQSSTMTTLVKRFIGPTISVKASTDVMKYRIPTIRLLDLECH